MGKQNYCGVVLYYKCNAPSDQSSCKFYKNTGGEHCHYLSELKYCVNTKAHDHAIEEKRKKDYSLQKLTA